MTFLAARPPAPWLVKLRDRFAPSHRLSVRTSSGVIPYDHNDLVAKLVGRGQFECGELTALLRVLPVARGMVDVGANLGLYTLLGARHMASPATVVAFEASPIEFDKLQWTVRHNSLSNVHAVHAAVSDAQGELTIYQSLDGSGALNRVDRPAKGSGTWQATRVVATTLDSWFDANPVGPIDLMKIDVEGHELPVLCGARELIARERPVVLIEINPSRASEVSDPARIWEFLTAAGYDWYQIGADTGRVEPCAALGSAINMFAVPRDIRNPALKARLLAG
jgi:FkbM family methyltransferase